MVPISAYKGENLVKRSAKLEWYKGKPLIDVLYKEAKKEGRSQKGALRIVMQGVIPGEAGEHVVGRIASGTIKAGEKVNILPQGAKAKVMGVTVKGKLVKVGNVGENVALQLDRNFGDEMRGSIISDMNHKPKMTDVVKLRIFVTGRFGKRTVAKFNGVDIECKSVRILHDIDTTTGEPRSTKKATILEAVEAEVRLARKVPVESYETTRELGRFVLYSDNKFAGIGIFEG